MAGIPAVSNVFGYLHSAVGLEAIQEVLCSRLGLSGEQVRVTRNAVNGSQTLQIETVACSLEIRPFKPANRWQFDGAVAGNPDEIYATLLPIVQNLGWAGFAASFEIYDASFHFAGECPQRCSSRDRR